ncbi:MAG: hypothetical protein LBV02_04010, partial [Bacteroidales bacterium]|nr:hypothetical protein [Bacteroidales bacterium]
MKKALFLIVMLCFSELLFSQQTCTEPTNLSLIEATSSTIKFSWDVVSRPSNTRSNLELWNEADLVNFAGRGNNGSDVSALYGGGTTLGQEAKSPSQKVADDFTLNSAAFVTQMDFYAYQPQSGTNPSPITGAYIEIYDVCPTDTTVHPIWNGLGSNLLSASHFSGVYRTTASGFSETSCPIMKVTANINTSLAAGTYWVSVSLTGVSSLAAPCITPRVVPNQTRTGNAIVLDLQNSVRWQEWKMGGSLENMGMPFTVKGYTNDSIVGFNVYRNNTLISSNYGRFNYTDQGLAQATTYNYQVEALYQNGCTSSRSTSASFSTLTNPCIITGVPYKQQFSTPGVGFIPTCWSIAATATDPYHSTQEYTTSPSSMLLPASAGMSAMAIMPPVSTVIPMTGLQLVFYARKSNANAKLTVSKVMDMTAPLTDKIDVTGATPSQVDVWEKFTINLSGITEDNNRNLAFVATDGDVYIDDLTLRTIPTCPSPEALSIQNITSTSAD